MPHALTPSPPKHYQDLPRWTKRQEKVAAALELARECPEGVARDDCMRTLLDEALAESWQRVLDAPDTYVMARDEYAVFNFFQHLFEGNPLAVKARARFWNNKC